MNLPTHLSKFQAMGGLKNEVIAQFELGNYKNFVYLILDWSSKKAAWIDPQEDISEPLNWLQENHFELEKILLTHTHFDHIAGLPKLVQLFPKIPIILNSKDLHRLNSAITQLGHVQPISHEELIHIGNLILQAIHTPGHSAGGCCYFLKGQTPYLLTGDTLFIRDCGRTDLETGNNEEMFHSLQRIKKFPPQTVILPGHHYQKECASVLSQEIKDSAPLRCSSVQELASLP